MLRIYSTIIDVLTRLRPVIAQIESHDRDLARQLRRASASVALNVSEGSGCRGGTRRERYCNALGSARETGACLDVAVTLGYVENVDASLLDRLDFVRATLVRNVTWFGDERGCPLSLGGHPASLGGESVTWG